MTPCIDFRHVTKHYPEFTLDITMRVMPNTITALVGTNGSGKTTAFRLALGLAGADSGEALLLGQPACGASPGVRRRVAAVFADTNLGTQSPIRDLLAQLAAFYPHFNLSRCHELLDRFAIPVQATMQSLSTGMRAKCATVMAVCKEADILVLDEPTAGLDVIARDDILDLLRAYMETPGRSILISSHIASDIETLCDDFYYIRHGRIVLHDTINRLRDNYGVLLVGDGQAAGMDEGYILARQHTPNGWRMLTDQRDFYRENMPGMEIERGNIDALVTVMEKGGLQ